MEVYYIVNGFIDGIFIKGLFISVLSIIFAGRVFKTDTRNAFVIIKWIILAHAGLTIFYYLIVCLSPAEMDTTTILNRATGPYWWAYYMMFIPNTLLPLLLLFKKIGRNKYILLALSVLMNLGWVLELIVMYTTDRHREYSAHLSYNFVWLLLLQGFVIGGVIYFVGNIINRKRLKSKAQAFE